MRWPLVPQEELKRWLLCFCVSYVPSSIRNLLTLLAPSWLRSIGSSLEILLCGGEVPDACFRLVQIYLMYIRKYTREREQTQTLHFVFSVIYGEGGIYSIYSLFLRHVIWELIDLTHERRVWYFRGIYEYQIWCSKSGPNKFHWKRSLSPTGVDGDQLVPTAMFRFNKVRNDISDYKPASFETYICVSLFDIFSLSFSLLVTFILFFSLPLRSVNSKKKRLDLLK